MARATAHPNHRCVSSEDVNGTEVYGTDGKNIGEIDHLIIDKVTGRVAYAVMSFGGFLGLGHSHYPIPWSALRYDTSLGGFRTDITEQQLKDAPEFSDDAWQDRDWETRTPDITVLPGIGRRERASRTPSPDWIKTKNPTAPAVRREAEEDWR
jgi:sporulation protein YlmC with PRC-barrel domain